MINIKPFVETSISALKAKTLEFWYHPVRHTLRIMALFIAIQVILSLIGELFTVNSIIYFNFEESLFMLLIAWILINSNISKVVIGLFLIFVFFISITLLIVPINEIVKVISASVESEYREAQRASFRLEAIDRGLSDAEFYIAEERIPDRSNSYYLESVKSAKVSFDEIRKSVQALLNEYKPNPEEKLFYGILDTLKLFLSTGAPFIFTMLMGALGSSIVVTRQFITDYDAESPSWYLYRLLQGMVMALLIIYGVTAGMLSLGKQEPIDINNFDSIKYFIGFVSALAGLFSEQAFVKLNAVSKTLFGGE